MQQRNRQDHPPLRLGPTDSYVSDLDGPVTLHVRTAHPSPLT